MDSNLQIPFTWDLKKPIDELWDAACCDPEFLHVMDIDVTPTPSDIKEARAIVFQTPTAPDKPSTPGAARAVRNLLSRYDFSLADESARLRTYAVSRLLELAESEKETVALGAIEKIGKIAEVGLFETKITVDIHQRTTEELEKDLQGLLSKYMDGLKVVNG